MNSTITYIDIPHFSLYIYNGSVGSWSSSSLFSGLLAFIAFDQCTRNYTTKRQKLLSFPKPLVLLYCLYLRMFKVDTSEVYSVMHIALQNKHYTVCGFVTACHSFAPVCANVNGPLCGTCVVTVQYMCIMHFEMKSQLATSPYFKGRCTSSIPDLLYLIPLS